MKVKVGIVDFEADLDELLKICEILKRQLRKEHRKELKELLDEINKIYEIIVNALNAFEEIPYKDPEFTKNFANRRAAFSKQYMMDKETVGYRCSEVKKSLDKLTGPSVSRKFVSMITRKPIMLEEYLDESRIKLRRHVGMWYISDRQVYYRLEELQKNLLSGLDEINNILITDGIVKAELELNQFINESRSEFERVKKLTAKLQHLSREL